MSSGALRLVECCRPPVECWCIGLSCVVCSVPIGDAYGIGSTLCYISNCKAIAKCLAMTRCMAGSPLYALKAGIAFAMTAVCARVQSKQSNAVLWLTDNRLSSQASVNALLPTNQASDKVHNDNTALSSGEWPT